MEIITYRLEGEADVGDIRLSERGAVEIIKEDVRCLAFAAESNIWYTVPHLRCRGQYDG
jgi:hypothetical protein